MPKYRKKPVIIEAMQFDGTVEGAIGILKWAITQHDSENVTAASNGNDRVIYIDTLEGKMKASAGDYVIRGVQGEFYPCKPDIFEHTYEPVEGIVE